MLISFKRLIGWWWPPRYLLGAELVSYLPEDQADKLLESCCATGPTQEAVIEIDRREASSVEEE